MSHPLLKTTLNHIVTDRDAGKTIEELGIPLVDIDMIQPVTDFPCPFPYATPVSIIDGTLQIFMRVKNGVPVQDVLTDTVHAGAAVFTSASCLSFGVFILRNDTREDTLAYSASVFDPDTIGQVTTANMVITFGEDNVVAGCRTIPISTAMIDKLIGIDRSASMVGDHTSPSPTMAH